MLQGLKDTVVTVIDDFKTAAQFSVVLGYDLSLVISARGYARIAQRIIRLQKLLKDDEFLDGHIDVRDLLL